MKKTLYTRTETVNGARAAVRTLKQLYPRCGASFKKLPKPDKFQKYGVYVHSYCPLVKEK